MKYDLRGLLALCLVFVGTDVLAQTHIPAYNTYLTAPFVVDDNNGLAVDLVEYLNERLKGKYSITLQNIPRVRLNQLVIADPDFEGIVLLLNPAFVDDAEKSKYFWTAAIIADKNNVVSPLSKPIEYHNPDSLQGKRFVGIKDHRYAGLDDRFGVDIKRFDINTELAMLKTVALNRADVTVLAALTYNYLMKSYGADEGLNGKLYVSTTPHRHFDRYMFVSRKDAALSKELSAVAQAMPNDPAWKAILAKYGAKD